MKSLAVSCEGMLRSNSAIMLHGLGINGQRSGRQRIIPAIDAKRDFLSLICCHGKTRLRVDGEELELPGPSVALWEPSHIVDYGEANAKWSVSWLQAWGRGPEEAVASAGVQLNKPFPVQDCNAFVRRISDILEELRRYKSPDSGIILNHFNGLLLELRRASQGRAIPRQPIDKRLLKVKAMIDEGHSDGLSLGDLAKAACMSRHHLCRRFKLAFGSSPVECMTKLRLESAAASLADAELSIFEAAERSGFKGLSNFSKTFKRHFGVSPQAYRAKLLKIP